MKIPTKWWGGLGGLVSGVLMTFINLFSFAFAGLPFVILLTPLVLIWKRRSAERTSFPWGGISVLLLICLAAPWLSLLLVGLASWLPSYRAYKDGPSLPYVLGLFLAFEGWTVSLATSLKFITGKWDRQFAFHLLVSGMGVFVLALALDYLSQSRHDVFDRTLFLAGQSVSGFLLGASLERQHPGTMEIARAPATTM
jgi:hypothetical protein